jgi:hypothetical protein
MKLQCTEEDERDARVEPHAVLSLAASAPQEVSELGKGHCSLSITSLFTNGGGATYASSVQTASAEHSVTDESL